MLARGDRISERGASSRRKPLAPCPRLSTVARGWNAARLDDAEICPRSTAPGPPGRLTMKLPPNVSKADFTAALKEFASIVGDQWVFTADEDLELYRDSYSILWDEADERTASAAVAPDNA